MHQNNVAVDKCHKILFLVALDVAEFPRDRKINYPVLEMTTLVDNFRNVDRDMVQSDWVMSQNPADGGKVGAQNKLQ